MSIGHDCACPLGRIRQFSRRIDCELLAAEHHFEARRACSLIETHIAF